MSQRGISFCGPVSWKSTTWEWSHFVTVLNSHFVTCNDPIAILVALIVVSLQKSQWCSHAFNFAFMCNILRQPPGSQFAEQQAFVMIPYIFDLFCNDTTVMTMSISTRISTGLLRMMRQDVHKYDKLASFASDRFL